MTSHPARGPRCASILRASGDPSGFGGAPGSITAVGAAGIRKIAVQRETTVKYDFSKSDILVIDDQELIRGMVRGLLTSLGVRTVIQARDGAEGLRLIAEKRPTCVLCDINMAQLDGLEFLKAVRSGHGATGHDLPIALLTGHSDIEIIDTAMALDVNAFILKPVSGQQLSGRLTRVLSQPRSYQNPLDYAAIDLPKIRGAAAGTEPPPPPPRRTAEAPLSGEIPLASAPLAPINDLTFDFSRSDVLVIDDQEVILGMVRGILGGLQVRSIIQARDGTEGLKLLAEKQPSCVLCDINMAPMNGIAFLKTVRSGKAGVPHDLPVALLTGHSDPKIIDAALALDVSAFILKPVSGHQLATRVARILTQKQVYQSAQAYAAVSAGT